MNDIGKALIGVGIALIVLGVLFSLGGRLPWLGRLPGDIRVERENFRFYFPITTTILISLLLTVLVQVIKKFF